MENRRVEEIKTFSTWGQYFAYKKSREFKSKGFNESGVSVQATATGESLIVAKYYKIV